MNEARSLRAAVCSAGPSTFGASPALGPVAGALTRAVMSAAAPRLSAMPATMIAAPTASPRRLMSLRSGMRGPPREPPEGCRDRQGEDIEHADMEAERAHRRRHQPVDVDHVHGEKPGGERAEEERRALGAAEKQDRERREEMEHHQDYAERHPAGLQARHVPGDLARQVADPDDQELHEREVG